MTQKSPGTAPVSMAEGRRAAYDSRENSLVSPTVRCHVELFLSSNGGYTGSQYRLSIEAPTLQAASSISQAALARLFATASQDQSTGGTQGE